MEAAVFFRVSGDSQHDTVVIALSAGHKIVQMAKDCAQQANLRQIQKNKARNLIFSRFIAELGI